MKIELSNVFGKVFLIVSYDAKYDWITNTWMGYQTPESVIYGANTCLDFLKKYNCTRLLNDNQLVVGPWNHSTAWIANDWTPRAIAAGLTHFANVVSPEAMARSSALDMSVKIGDSFTMNIFDNIEVAKDWLQSKVPTTITPL